MPRRVSARVKEEEEVKKKGGEGGGGGAGAPGGRGGAVSSGRRRSAASMAGMMRMLTPVENQGWFVRGLATQYTCLEKRSEMKRDMPGSCWNMTVGFYLMRG